MSDAIKCYYTLSGINYKNGFVTSCPQQSDHLYVIRDNNNSLKPSDIINSDGFKKHRMEMMSGQWSSGCHICKDIEQANAGRSMRMDYVAEDDFYNYETGEIDPSSVRHVELRFSNSCNMACKHCGDVYSSGWTSKLKYYEPDEEDRSHNLIQLTKQFHRVSVDEKLSIDLDLDDVYTIVSDLNANFPNIEKIDFAGGEVLYQKQFFPCLELLGQHPNRDNITICFHSNFNARADMSRLYELLLPFGGRNIKHGQYAGQKAPRATIMMSLDSGTNIYPYFRSGDWDKLTENIRTIQELDKDRKIFLSIVCTTSAYQVMDIVNIFESFLTLDVDTINASIVYTPSYLNPSVMLVEHKESVLADIKEAKRMIMLAKIHRQKNLIEYSKRRSWRPNLRVFRDLDTAEISLNHIEKYLLNQLPDPEKYEAFKVYIRKSDAIWKHNFNDYMERYRFENDEIIRIKND